jgi:hypothetical protein
VIVVSNVPRRRNIIGDNARKGAVRKRSQLETKITGEKHWTKRSKESGQFSTRKKRASSKACAGRGDYQPSHLDERGDQDGDRGSEDVDASTSR